MGRKQREESRNKGGIGGEARRIAEKMNKSHFLTDFFETNGAQALRRLIEGVKEAREKEQGHVNDFGTNVLFETV
jgi:hypothetical protein